MCVYVLSRLPDQTVYILYVCLYPEPVTRSKDGDGPNLTKNWFCLMLYTPVSASVPQMESMPLGGDLLFEDGKSKLNTVQRNHKVY